MQPTVGGTIPKQVGMNCLRKVVECEPRIKPESNVALLASASSFYLEFLPYLFSMKDCKL